MMKTTRLTVFVFGTCAMASFAGAEGDQLYHVDPITFACEYANLFENPKVKLSHKVL